MNFIDSFLNKITMYRLVLYYLVLLVGAAAVLGFFNILPESPVDLAFSTLLILVVCWVVNKLFARVFRVDPNVESVYITALILTLLITPVNPSNSVGIGFLVFASAWAMASKYLFAIGNKHIFNPAALGIALSAIVLAQGASWWAGSSQALPPLVLLGGLLVVRKIRRFDLVIAFFTVALLTVAFTTTDGNYTKAILQTLQSSPIFFLAFVMLTEPLTMPPSRTLRIIYGAIVGFFFAPNIHLGSFYFTPEVALLVGNVFVYIVSPKGRFALTLVGKKEIATDTYEFSFAPDRRPVFLPGQYLEWTLGHRSSDSRGNRRFFTIASSPTESVVRLGVKFHEPTSSFKRALRAMPEGDKLSASHIAGDFTLPKDTEKKLVFIAGGIGITPFRSMTRYLIDTGDARTITLFYSNKTALEVAYKDLFDEAAQKIGMKTVYTLTNEPNPALDMHKGKIDRALIESEVPDYQDRIFYISGPNSMVKAFKKTLRDMGISRGNIKTDYFPGFA